MANEFDKLDAQDEISSLAQVQSNEPQAGEHCSIEQGDCKPDYWINMAKFALGPFFWM